MQKAAERRKMTITIYCLNVDGMKKLFKPDRSFKICQVYKIYEINFCQQS